jgi:hypothetical protein
MQKHWYPAAFTALAIGCGGGTGAGDSFGTGGVMYGVLSGGGASTGTATTAPGGNVDAGAPIGGRTVLTAVGGTYYGMGGRIAVGGLSNTGGTSSTGSGTPPRGGTTSSGAATTNGGTHLTSGGIDAGFPTGGADSLGGVWSVDYGANFYGGSSSIDIPETGDAGVDRADGG